MFHQIRHVPEFQNVHFPARKPPEANAQWQQASKTSLAKLLGVSRKVGSVVFFNTISTQRLAYTYQISCSTQN